MVDTSVDYYKLLHVQHDAPEPVIKASYRAMMQKLKHHPDKGGDVEFAQLLNDAAKTLCNPDTRAQYDALRNEIVGSSSPSQSPTDNVRTAREEASKNWGAPGGSPTSEQSHEVVPEQHSTQVNPLSVSTQCPFCLNSESGDSSGQFPVPAYEISRRCKKCNGATTPITHVTLSDDEELRRLHRQAFKSPAQLWMSWPSSIERDATVTDFSPEGCAMLCDAQLALGQIVMIETALFNAICRVRHCSSVDSNHWVSGLSFLTLDMRATPGTLLNATA